MKNKIVLIIGIAISVIAVLVIASCLMVGESDTSTQEYINELDWISQDDLSDTVGVVVVSGLGIRYTAVAVEDNADAGGGRERVVLLSEDGAKRMIPNLPSFYIDDAKGGIYFNIVDYVSNPDYTER